MSDSESTPEPTPAPLTGGMLGQMLGDIRPGQVTVTIVNNTDAPPAPEEE